MTSSATNPSASSSQIFRLYLNTTTSLPYSELSKPSREATIAWTESPTIAPILARLSDAERASIARFYHTADAARCAGSWLLKHLAIMRGVGVSFSKSIISQERSVRNGKPHYKAQLGNRGVEFNVSHHGAYVVCIGTSLPDVNVGIDVVQADYEREATRIQKNGFQAWIEMYSDVLSLKEISSAVELAFEQGHEVGLRRFYTIWAAKEAFVKMTGDALLVDWLKELSFPELRVLEPAVHGIWGETVTTSVAKQGKVVEGVRLELVALGKDYIIASAVDCPVTLPAFERVEIEDNSSLLCHDSSTNNSLRSRYSLED